MHITNPLLHRRHFIAGTLACFAPLGANAITRPLAQIILEKTNETRRISQRNILQPSGKLTRAAENYAQVLGRYRTLSHSVDGTYLTQRAQSVGYQFARLAENIGWIERRGDVEDVAGWFIDGWMHSSGHRRNILDTRLDQIGIGITRVEQRFYAVQFFGTRA